MGGWRRPALANYAAGMVGIRDGNRIARGRMTPRRRLLQRLLFALLVAVSLLLSVLRFLRH